MMIKRTKINSGDIIIVPLSEGLIAVGIILHISEKFRGSMLVGYYNQAFESVADINITSLENEFIDTPNYTNIGLVTEGPWEIIGNSPKLLATAIIPELRVAYHIYYKDDIVKKVNLNEFRQYSVLEGQGQMFIENKLRRYFAKKSI